MVTTPYRWVKDTRLAIEALDMEVAMWEALDGEVLLQERRAQRVCA
jgi:hypothetical protein